MAAWLMNAMFGSKDQKAAVTEDSEKQILALKTELETMTQDTLTFVLRDNLTIRLVNRGKTIVHFSYIGESVYELMLDDYLHPFTLKDTKKIMKQLIDRLNPAETSRHRRLLRNRHGRSNFKARAKAHSQAAAETAAAAASEPSVS
jgi:hypothetical protein